MSDLYKTNSALLFDELSDSDSEDSKTAGNESNDSPSKFLEMGDKSEKSGRLPLPLGNTTIETPTNFALNVDTRSGSSVGKHADSVQSNDSDVRNGSLNLKNQYAGNRSGSFNVQQEKLAKIDSQLSTSPQRKLPIPNMALNTNPNLKGILIKPKRILPAKPDHLKVKSAQIRQSSKFDDKLDQGLSLAGDVVLHGQTVSNSDEKQTTNSPTDVDKIKSYFRKHGPKLTDSKYKGTEEIDLSPDYDDQINVPVLRSQSECGYLIKDETARDLKAPDNKAQTEEWGTSDSSKEENNNKMTSDTNVPRSLEHGIRSPSPKSNTTWDRSSSGYSSDERPDPRSPPPVSSAGTSSKHSLDNDDEILIPEIEAGIASLTGSDKQLDTGADIRNTDKSYSESAILDSDNVTPENCSHTLQRGLSVTPHPTRCANCDIMSKTKTDLGLQTHSSAFESVMPGARQLFMQKPAWTSPTKIQYRKSASEAMINLKHPGNKQTASGTHGGLEVLGKSCRQPSNVTAPTFREEGENGARYEIPTPGSADIPDDGARDADLTLDLLQCDARSQEAAKTRMIRQQPITLSSPRDMKMNMNGR